MSVMWGGWTIYGTRQAPFDMTAETDFEAHAGRKPSLIHWSSRFASLSTGAYFEFQRSAFDNVWNYGATPLFSWNVEPYTNAQVLSGAHDAYIRRWAQGAKKWAADHGNTSKTRILLRFNWEMNGSWFSWGGSHTTPAEYIATWRHVHDIFVQEGATNVQWVWCVNEDQYGKLPFEQYYPGNSYVDWTGFDAYNFNSPWRSFEQAAGSTYDRLLALAPLKLVVVAETASTESGGNKAQWITDALAVLPTRFPKVRAFSWFQKAESFHGYTDWQIESSAAAQAAFKAGIAASTFG